MTDAYRTSKSIVFSLDTRQVSGIIGGSLALLVVTFGLGVGFGHRLAASPTRAPDIKAPGQHVDETVYTFQKELTKKDAPPASPPPKPAPPKVEAPPVVKPPVAVAPAAVPTQVAPAMAPAPAAPVVAAAPEVVVPKPDTQARFTVQFGAPSKDTDAKRLVQQLSAFGYDPFITEADLPGKGHVFRVRIGRFANREDADRFHATVRQAHNLDSVVMAASSP